MAAGPLLNSVFHSLFFLGVSVDDVLRDLFVLADSGLSEDPFDQDRADAKDPDFVVQSFGVTFERVLARAVNAHERRGKKTERRADVHDAPAALRPHRREDSLGHTQGAKEIGVELLLRFFNAGLFQGSGEAVVGVVNEDVDLAGLLKNGFHALSHTRVVGQVCVDQ